MGERAVRGVSAAPGVAVGAAVVLDRSLPLARKVIAPGARGREADRARAALEAAATELEDLASRLRDNGRSVEAEVVETGVLMAADPTLIERVESLIRDGVPADAALRTATEQIAMELARLTDPTLALRADDVRSLGRRAASQMRGGNATYAGGILIAKSVGPADVADLKAAGIALSGGGVTAHAAIVARSLGIPMVVALGPEVLELADGEEVLLDGGVGALYRHPDPARVAAAMAESDRVRDARSEAIAQRLEPARTLDGHVLRVLANAASVAEVIESIEQGAEGVGLLRTELLFLDAQGWPTQAQQASFLGPILAPLSNRMATVRLLDFGGDKTPPFLRGATGRGIELLLESPDALRAQLSAIVAAGGRTKLRILIPMVTSPGQVRAVREMLARALDGRPSPQVGAMIETPEAAHRADEIANVCDFLSIGTNDLTQLVLGLDREQSKSAPVTDLRVLRLIDATTRAARAAAIPVDVCGEAASDAGAMPILVGLGVDELSVAAARVGEVRKWVRGLDFTACREAAAKRLLEQPADADR
jgi:phosphoenolpyruvate-protein kinase (PTS system EI component)